MPDLYIKKINETYISLEGEASVLQELRDLFSFYADGYKYHQKYRSRIWDGKIRLLKLLSQTRGQIYYGLLHEIVRICKSRDYTVEIFDELKIKDKPKTEDLENYINNLNLTAKGQRITPRDYQIKAFVDAIRNKRQLITSPTACLHPETLIECEISDDAIEFLKSIHQL